MRLFYLFLSAICVCSVVVYAADNLETCQSLVLASEQKYDAKVYEKCGFNDLKTAVGYWAPLAEQKGWKIALYEIYHHHKTYPSTKTYLYKSAKLGFAPALVLMGDELFDQGKIPEAMKYYGVAVKGDVDEATRGKITGRLALLYINPSSSYYNAQKALPLLKKAALQRDALSNNVMGVLSLSGVKGVKQDAQEAFKYFWRAILLGCPAAEENLGFFMLANDHKIDNAMLLKEMSSRTYSCSSVKQTSVNYPLYHLTFSQKQCADINYYAERLVDISLPFTGKKECAFSSDMGDIADFLSK